MIERFGLYLILTDPAAGYAACAEAAVAAHVRYLQLRMKREAPADRRAVAHQVRAITRGTPTRFILNDDAALAREVDADGLHLGQDDPPGCRTARAAWGIHGKIIGLSTHNRLQAAAATGMGADYIGVGPVFPTPTKPGGNPPLGVQRAAAIVEESPVTAVAIGGIDETTLPEVLAAGPVNFAVVRAVCAAADPAAAISRLQAIWHRHMAAAGGRV